MLKIWEQNVGEKLTTQNYLNRMRDVFKEAVIMETSDITCILLGIENHRQKHDLHSKDEFLSGFSKQDRIKPVITLVVYFGTERWDGPRSLSDIMNIPDEFVREYVQDYKILLIEPSGLQEEDFKKFKSDLGMTLKILKNASDEKSIEQAIHSSHNPIISRKAADVLEACANIKIHHIPGEETIDMCKGWDDHYESGRLKGVQQGADNAAHDIALKLYNQHMSISFISQITNRTEDQIKSWILSESMIPSN